MARRNGRPPSQERRFVKITHVRCPSCEDGRRGASDLRNDGGPVVIGGGQLRGSSRYVGLTKATTGCELCEGTGAISTSDRERLLAAGYNPFNSHLDPYSLDLPPAR